LNSIEAKKVSKTFLIVAIGLGVKKQLPPHFDKLGANGNQQLIQRRFIEKNTYWQSPYTGA
jgi:hypothetical protein